MLEESRPSKDQTDVGSVLINIGKIILLLLNVAFLICGAILVYFSNRVKTSGWLDVFDGDYEWIGTTAFVFLLLVGVVVVLLSILGFFGALLQNRIMLLSYMIALVITAVFFIVVAVGGAKTDGKAKDWASSSYPAVESEETVGSNFNQLYCLSQVPYYCEDAPVADTFSLFGYSTEGFSGYFGPTTSNITSLCGVLAVDAIDTICKVCDEASKYDSYKPVVDWAEGKCPRNKENQLWCGKLLLEITGMDGSGSGEATSGIGPSGSKDPVEHGAPYSQCRDVFLGLVSKWSSLLLDASIVIIVILVILAAFTWYFRSKSTDNASRNLIQ